MIIIKYLFKAVDWLSEWTGRAVSWVAVSIMLTMTYEVIMRFLFRAPNKWITDITIMSGGTLMLLGAAYVMLHNGNVRVDVFYAKWSPKAKAAVDLFFLVTYLFGAIFVFTQQAWVQARVSYLQHEISQWGYWEPTIVPFRFVVAYGFSLLALQTLSWFVKNLYQAITGKEITFLTEGGKKS